jgi:ADP-ribose pyrophosphatase YjhB (NUDIX family)
MNTAIHVTARALIFDQQELLVYKTLAHDGSCIYYLPGGHIEHEEKAEVAVLRELEEELGVGGELMGFVGVLENIFDARGRDNLCHNHSYELYFQVRVPNLRERLVDTVRGEPSKVTFITRADSEKIRFAPSELQKMLPLWWPVTR